MTTRTHIIGDKEVEVVVFGGSTYNNESWKRLLRVQLSLLRWPVDEAWLEAMGFTDAPGQKAARVPRGSAPLADVVPGAQCGQEANAKRGETAQCCCSCGRQECRQ